MHTQIVVYMLYHICLSKDDGQSLLRGTLYQCTTWSWSGFELKSRWVFGMLEGLVLALTPEATHTLCSGVHIGVGWGLPGLGRVSLCFTILCGLQSWGQESLQQCRSLVVLDGVPLCFPLLLLLKYDWPLCCCLGPLLECNAVIHFSSGMSLVPVSLKSCAERRFTNSLPQHTQTCRGNYHNSCSYEVYMF